MRMPTIELSSPIRFQPDLDDCECTTATTASINNVQSWNTLPTRDVFLESSSVSWHEFFEEDYKMHRRWSSDPNLAEQEHVTRIMPVLFQVCNWQDMYTKQARRALVCRTNLRYLDTFLSVYNLTK
jgi:hypothetical protein